MNKTLKITLICVAAVLAVLLIGKTIVRHVAVKNVRAALENVPGARIQFQDLSFSLLAGNVGLRDVEFELSDSTVSGQKIEGSIHAIELEGIKLRRLLKGEARARCLLIKKPVIRVTLDEKAPEAPEDTAISADASFLRQVFLSELKVEKGSIGLQSLNNSTKASVQNLGFSLKDIEVLPADKKVEFNDSSYHVSLDSLDFIDPDGLNRVQIAHLSTSEAGPVQARGMHLYNCVPMEAVAEKMGKVAAMWYDVQLDSLLTSEINLPRLAREKNIEIKSISVSGPKAVIFQDDRYPPAVPYPTMQEGINAVEMPLHIQEINAHFKDFSFIWETSKVNRGSIPMQNVRVALTSVSNAKDNVMGMTITSRLTGKGRLNMMVSTRNNHAETTTGKITASDLDASRMDSFLRPLFGVTAQANMQKIDCTFKGNKTKMAGDFCMIYNNLTVKAWDDKTAPFQIVAQHSGAINFLANVALPDSNPKIKGKDPKRVNIEFERDPMQPYPAYLIQCMTNGMLKTVLPGGAIKKAQAKKAQASKKK